MMLLWGCLGKESAGSDWSDYTPNSPDEPKLHSLVGFVALTCYYQMTFPAQVHLSNCIYSLLRTGLPYGFAASVESH